MKKKKKNMHAGEDDGGYDQDEVYNKQIDDGDEDWKEQC